MSKRVFSVADQAVHSGAGEIAAIAEIFTQRFSLLDASGGTGLNKVVVAPKGDRVSPADARSGDEPGRRAYTPTKYFEGSARGLMFLPRRARSRAYVALSPARQTK